MQSFRRFLAALSTLIVGAGSFALSFVALRDVSVEVGAVPAYLGFLVPIVIDGGIICGSAVIWSLSKETERRPIFPFLFVGSLVTVSVVVNTNHAAPGLLAKLIAALPPLILLGTLELVAAQGRRQSVKNNSQPNTSLSDSNSSQTGFEPLKSAPHNSVNTQPLKDISTLEPLLESQCDFPSSKDRKFVEEDIVSKIFTEKQPQFLLAANFDKKLDCEIEQLVDNYADRSPQHTRPAATRRPVRVRAEKPSG